MLAKMERFFQTSFSFHTLHDSDVMHAEEVRAEEEGNQVRDSTLASLKSAVKTMGLRIPDLKAELESARDALHAAKVAASVPLLSKLKRNMPSLRIWLRRMLNLKWMRI